MSIENKTQIKTYFETSDVPTQAQFINLIDSYADYGVQTTVQSNSASWGIDNDDQAVNTLVHSNSGNWNNAYDNILILSGNFLPIQTSVQNNSANWVWLTNTGTSSPNISTNNIYPHTAGATISAHGNVDMTGDLTVNNHYISPKTTTLSPQASVTTDLSTGNTFRLTLTGSTMLMNPTNATDGASYVWYINQGTGSHTITLGDKFIIPTTATTPLAFSTSANYMDIFAARADTVLDKMYVVSIVPGYDLT